MLQRHHFLLGRVLCQICLEIFHVTWFWTGCISVITSLCDDCYTIKCLLCHFNYMLHHTVNTITIFWFCVGIIHVTPYSEQNYHNLLLYKHTCMLQLLTGVRPYNDNNIIYMCRLVTHVSGYMLRHVLIVYIR